MTKYIVLGQAIRVSHHPVNAFIAEDNVSYQYAPGDNMEEAAEAQQSECAVHFGIA